MGDRKESVGLVLYMLLVKARNYICLENSIEYESNQLTELEFL